MKKKESLKIAYVTDTIWPYFKGGKEKRLYDLSTRLAVDGYDVHIYTMKWWTGPSVIKENGRTLHAICKLYPIYSGPRRSIKEGIMFGLSCLRLVTEHWDVIDVDHMPFFPLYSVKLICLIKRKKMIATWHEVWGRDYWVKYIGKLGYISYIIEKIAVLLPDKIISISEHTSKKLKTELISKKEIVTIPIGVDIGLINSVKPSMTKSDVIYVGRLLSHKNVDVLIKSIAILKKNRPNIKCLIISDGPEKKNLEKLSTSLNLVKNILFLGFVKDINKIYALMKSSKVFVLPSTREGFGIVVIEANACGIPVVTINHKDNAAKDLIGAGKNGYICNLDGESIAQRIGEIIKKGEDIKTKQSCINSAKKYDWNKIVEEVKEAYSK